METVAERMVDTLRHRGPDDAGVWVRAQPGIALGFRRLAILDLSLEGHQPMVSATGRYAIVLNGEVYNFRRLRDELQVSGHPFRSGSDTEVLLAAIVEWGLRETLNRLNGMFAFALWDAVTEQLSLVRDRVGKKPLYYGWAGETFLFGSELKALQAHPALRHEIDRAALAAYFRRGYVPSPQTIFAGIHQLLPGTFVQVAAEGCATAPEAYWSRLAVARAGRSDPFEGTVDEALDELDGLLGDAVALRMVADVPLGAFLSGGVDSSLVVALMQAQSIDPVRTFTVGFQEHGYDEAPAALRVASLLGTDHTEVYVSSAEAREVIPWLPALYDEPFADSSQIPTHLVSRVARRGVTVCLSGDGGDELFGGYGRYFLAERMWDRLARVPVALRPLAARAAAVAAAAADLVAVAPSGRTTPLGDRMQRLAAMLRDTTPAELYDRIASCWDPDDEIVIGAASANGRDATASVLDQGSPLLTELMLLDGQHYLPDDILTKVDRASMAVSLEVRNPLLDHRVVELADRLPLALKVRADEGKWPLRTLLRRHLPSELVDRPKAGFDVPVAEWLRGPLRGWAEELLDERRLRHEGYLHPEPIVAKWQEHLSGRRNWQHQLWAVLMFEAWLDFQSA
jgi:asparagine synthase (glutamine-hydrolysing)